MNAWWFSLLLAAIAAALLRSRRTLRLYFVAQLVNALAVGLASMYGVNEKFLLGLYIVTTIPILECSVFLLWDAGAGLTELLVGVNFAMIMGIIEAYDAHRWSVGTWVTFIEGLLLAVIGVMLVMTRDDATHIIGALSLALSCYDFAFVRNWRWANSWLPAAMCAVCFGWIAIRKRETAPL